MTLLRRKPREVYRVYSEDEFLADPLCDERMRSRDGASGGRRLKRVLGATLLFAALGAIAGLIAWTTALPAAGRRRERARTLAAVASIGPTRAPRPRVWRTRAPAAPAGQAHLGRRSVKRHDRAQPAGLRARRHAITSIRGGALRLARAAGRLNAAAPYGVRPVGAASADAPSALAAVAAGPPRPDHTEFGFER
ncbi:MAG: hypothetical protein ACRDJX_08310 [Solirubrobacteraceae bacterium]